jgi:hypothetical protein
MYLCKKSSNMAAITVTGNISELLHRVEQLAPREFEDFFDNILSINAKRRAKNLSLEETLLLQKINREFPTVKTERYLWLEDRRRQATLSPEEHRELLGLGRQLDRFDAQRLQWLGQLAILRNLPLRELMKQLGLLSKTDD